MGIKEFLIQARQFGFNIAFKNFLLVKIMKFVGAKGYNIQYKTKEVK